MKLCAACCQELPKESFSKKQWQSKQFQRRCIECIDDNRIVQLKAPPKIVVTEDQDRQSPCDANNGGVSCWICLEDGTDEFGQPLRRDCSCRGESAGFSHLSCIVKYAETKSENWDGHHIPKFVEPWRKCPNCHQDYQNELAVDLATEFATFVKGKYPGDQLKHLVALHSKLQTLQHMALEEEAEQIAIKMLSMIGEMKTSNPSLLTSILDMEGAVYNALGCFARGEKTKVGYFEKCRDISKVVGNDVRVNIAEQNIARAKSIYGEDSEVSNEEYLEKEQEWYKQYADQCGEKAQTATEAGHNLAIALYNADRTIEAERLLTKLAATSKRVHGPDHRLTQNVASDLQICKVRCVRIKYQNEEKFFQSLRYEEDWKTCIVQGPIADPRNIQDEKTVTIATEDILPDLGTPVVCHGLVSAPRLNGKIGHLGSHDEEADYYEVHFEDKGLKPCSVKRENIRILFELPDE